MTRKPFIDLILAAALLIVVLFGYGYWYAKVSQRSAEAAQLRSELTALGEVGGRSASTRRAFDELTRKETQVYQHLVGSSTIVAFLEELESRGEGLGADVEVVSVADPSGREGEPPQLQMSVRITGSFDAVMRTLGAIEYQAYDTRLSTLLLSSAEGVWSASATFLVGMSPAFPPAANGS